MRRFFKPFRRVPEPLTRHHSVSCAGKPRSQFPDSDNQGTIPLMDTSAYIGTNVTDESRVSALTVVSAAVRQAYLSFFAHPFLFDSSITAASSLNFVASLPESETRWLRTAGATFVPSNSGAYILVACGSDATLICRLAVSTPPRLSFANRNLSETVRGFPTNNAPSGSRRVSN